MEGRHRRLAAGHFDFRGLSVHRDVKRAQRCAKEEGADEQELVLSGARITIGVEDRI